MQETQRFKRFWNVLTGEKISGVAKLISYLSHTRQFQYRSLKQESLNGI